MLSFDNYSSDRVKAKVDLYNGATLVQSCDCSNFLEDFTVNRSGDNGKFFGFGVCQSIDLNFIDLNNNLDIEKGYTAEVYFGDGETYWNEVYPTFHLVEVNKDEKNGSITASAYDDIYRASEHTWDEVLYYLVSTPAWSAPYSLGEIYMAIARVMGWSAAIDSNVSERFDARFENVNYEGTETIREVLDDIAEVTQTIYFMHKWGHLRFVALEANGYFTSINKRDYYELNTLTPRTITGVASATELGENWGKNLGSGIMQFVRNNPFWELQTNVTDLVDAAAANVNGVTITQFDCDWDGDYRLEIGDRIALETDSGETVYTYVLNDTVTYDGTLNEFTQWEYGDNENETFSNPTNIKEALDKTYAKVDKIQKEITLYVGEIVDTTVQDKVDAAIDESLESVVTDVNNLKTVTNTHTEKISSLEMNTESIEATVSNIEHSNTVIQGEFDNIKTEQAAIKLQTEWYTDYVTEQLTDVKLTQEDLEKAQKTITGEQTTIKEDIASLTVNTEEISNNLSSLETKNTNLTARVTTNEGDIATVKSSQTETNDRVATLSTTLDGITARVGNVEKEITSTTTTIANDLGVIRGDITSLESDVDGVKSDLDAVEGDVKTVKGNITTITSEQTTIKEDLAALEVTTDGITANVSNLDTSIKNVEKKVETAEGDISTVKSNQSETDSKVATLTTSVNGITASVSSLEESTSEIETRVETAEGNITSLTSKQAETSSKLASLEVTTSGIEGRVETLENTTETSIALEKINDDISTLKTEQTTIKNNIAALQVKDNEIAGGVSSLQSTTTKISGDLSSVSSTVNTMQGDIDDMDGRLTTAQGHIVQVAQGLVDLGNSTATLFTNVNVEQTTMKQDIANLKVKDTEITASVSGLESTTTTLSTEVDGVISKQETMQQNISQLQMDKDSILASVNSLEKTTIDGLDEANNKITSLQKQAELAITSEDVSIQISTALEDGVTKVKTTTGYTFDEDGLHISKSGSPMNSTLDEEGLVVSNYSSPVLEALPEGVNAMNLTARQYLKIGGSRFQSHGYNRTGCFWIGD